MQKAIIRISLISCLVLTAFTSFAVAEEYAISPSSVTLAVGDSQTFSLTGAYDPHELVWKKNGTEYLGSGTSVSVTFSQAGTYSISVTGIDYLEDGTNPIINASATATVIEVEKLQYLLNGTWTDAPTGGFSDICFGSSIGFKAIPNPEDASWSSGYPIWSGDASGTGATKTVTFSTSGNRSVSATCGNTKTVAIQVDPTNTSKTITWTYGYTSDGVTGASTTIERNFTVTYTACADISNNVWKLRVESINGGADMSVHLGGYQTPIPGVNITTNAQGTSAINDMLLESSPSGPATTWVTEAAIRAHEEWHYDEWKEIGDHYWPATETAIENLTVPYNLYTSETAAIAALRAGANGADAKITAFQNICRSYWFTLGDSPGDRPYRAGGIVLNTNINDIKNYGAAQTPPWNLPSGSNAGPGSDHCYEPWLPYTP